MQTGQNSIAPESSLPQLGQVRWGSVFMGLPALQPQSEPKTTPRSTEWCEIVQRHPLANDGPASIASLCIHQGYQIRARTKIRDFEAQEFASPCCAGPLRSVMNNSETDISVEKQTPNKLEAHNCAVPCSSQRLYHNVLYDTSVGDEMNLQHANIRHSLTPE
jgi:hypothetical protein